MSNSITIRFRRGVVVSPILYCHWLGLEAVLCAHDAIDVEPRDPAGCTNHGSPTRLLANTTVLAMDGQVKPYSFYIESPDAHIWTDYGHWEWDIDREVWRVYDGKNYDDGVPSAIYTREAAQTHVMETVFHAA